MAELLLDANIRGYVFLPIVLITFLVGIVRHYIAVLTATPKDADILQVQDSQVMLRSRILRENGCYLTNSSYHTRRNYFNSEETGYFKTQKRASTSQNPMTDPSMMTDMLKGNITTVLPMIIIGGWINWMFSGFVTTKVPFPLTLRFKPMLQRGIELASLDASWVSSASWYFLNVFGLRSIYALVLGENNAADQSRQFQDQMSGAAMAMPTDPKAAFKSEWEALEINEHHWLLADVESDFTKDHSEEKVKAS